MLLNEINNINNISTSEEVPNIDYSESDEQ
ncbi:Uncharacterised protein [Legionella pneumophila]|nr:Uncharacterised protein [Legionella pneumophila]CZG04927.1 Uncharacterised protein [Legionella pneumophila]CZG08438.1 Uncharacterised protein [Legionella pneumophila]CZG09967.1 Uncharacterised protein [Legionella pneumophila]CZG16850.1 Uncharacterised protein [Legionella pneumophila]